MHLVGEGAYGIVLKCRDKETGTEVAIKKFKESEDDELVRKTIHREVDVLKMLNHPNIVNLMEAFRRGGKLYLVFEYVEKTVLEILEEHPYGVKPDLVCRYMFQLCCAIRECHRHNVIHRDIKPENLLVNPDHTLKLCDFGFARVVDMKDPRHLTDYVATRWYRAPELLVGSTTYGPGVDMWAIGCIMGELIDGQPLFAGESEIDQLYIIQKIMGALSPSHLELFLKNERFAGFKFPDMSRPEKLRCKYGRKVSKRALSFMNNMLNMEPKCRMASDTCQQHPFFAPFIVTRDKRDEHVVNDRQRTTGSASKRDKRRDKKGDKRTPRSKAKGRLKASAGMTVNSIASRVVAGAAAAASGGYAIETKQTKFPTCRPNSRKNKTGAQKRRKKKPGVSSFNTNGSHRYSNTGYAAPYSSTNKYVGKPKYVKKLTNTLGQIKNSYSNSHTNTHIKKAALATRNVENVAPLHTRFGHAPKKQLPQIEDGPPYEVKDEEVFKKSPFYVEPIPQFAHDAFNDT